ncbi:MAG: hypothetical protein KY455_04475 [Euryarchaeota archaeon]|nr:hypothetical protein [Euryarchaeota archaeon]
MSATEGHLIDVHPDGQGRMVSWVRTKEGVARFVEPFVPRFHVHASEADRRRLTRRLAHLDGRLGLSTVRARLGLARGKTEVLEVAVPHPLVLREVAQAVDRWGEHRAYDLFDVDLRDSHRYLLAKRVFPFARVRVAQEGRNVSMEALDGQWDLAPEPPMLRTLTLSAELDAPTGIPEGPAHPVRRVRLGDEEYRGDEVAVLEGLREGLLRLDPDVLLTRSGDRFLFGYLRARAKANGMRLRLGRDPDPRGPARRGRTFYTYGMVKWQPPVEVLHGRIHLDVASSFFHRESGLGGLVDLSRISSCPLQELARLGPGTAVTAVQIDRAKREERLVPWKKNLPETMKSERRLVESDRGGFIHDPSVGLFDDVVELDFSSMYPNIMVTRNVSPETVGCICCSPSTPGASVVPQVGYLTCRRPGFVGRSIKPLVARRESFKRLMKSDPKDRARWQGASDALKWLLVCSFGYQGYRNARFGRIECHEAICAWGREILLTTGEVAREEGFETLHGIVDSLWVKRLRKDADAERLSRRVSKEVGIRFDIEGAFDWIVFLPTRGHDATGVEAVGAMNRFYGKFSEPPAKKARSNAGQSPDHLAGGQLKVRGVEMRQRSAPGIVRRAQEAFLSAVFPATDAAGFRALLPEAIEAVRPVVEELRSGAVPLSDLLVQKTVGQPLAEYRMETETKSALRLLAQAGVQVPPGDVVRYVVLDGRAKTPERRVVEERVMTGDEHYDVAAYETLLFRSLESLLLPFGWDLARMRDHFSNAPQARLDRYGVEAVRVRS